MEVGFVWGVFVFYGTVWCVYVYGNVWCVYVYGNVWCVYVYGNVWCVYVYDNVWCMFMAMYVGMCGVCAGRRGKSQTGQSHSVSYTLSFFLSLSVSLFLSLCCVLVLSCGCVIHTHVDTQHAETHTP